MNARQRRGRAKTTGAPPLERYLTSGRRRRRIIAAVVVALLALAVAADRSGLLLQAGDDWSRYHGRTFQVVRVIDGDTLDVNLPDGDRPTTRVRVWGIDAPEMAWPERGRMEAQPFAEEAAALVRELVEGEQVRLVLERHRLRGGFGRLLAHVDLPDGTSLAERLLEAGLANVDERWTHGRMEPYAEAQRAAREAGRGMWSD